MRQKYNENDLNHYLNTPSDRVRNTSGNSTRHYLKIARFASLYKSNRRGLILCESHRPGVYKNVSCQCDIVVRPLHALWRSICRYINAKQTRTHIFIKWEIIIYKVNPSRMNMEIYIVAMDVKWFKNETINACEMDCDEEKKRVTSWSLRNK